jgi:ribosome biogenesis protein ENP2
VQAKIDKERESRIRGKKKVTAKVNRKFLERILEREEKNERKRAQRVLAQGGDEAAQEQSTKEASSRDETKALYNDARFARMFQEEDFAVDETSREFQQLNPSTNVAASNLDREKGLTAVEEEAIDEVPGSDDDGSTKDDIFGSKDRSTGRISTADYKRRPTKKQRQKDRMSMRVTSSASKNSSRLLRDRSFGCCWRQGDHIRANEEVKGFRKREWWNEAHSETSGSAKRIWKHLQKDVMSNSSRE